MAHHSLLTPQKVVNHLADLGKDLDITVNALQSAELDAVRKRHAANLAESKAFVEAEGSMDLRKHEARLSAGDLEGDALVAEALVRHLRATVRSIETRIDIGRSYGAAVRAELSMMPYTENQ